MTTLSIIKADTGGFVGHSEVHPEALQAAQAAVQAAVADGLPPTPLKWTSHSG